MEKVQQFMVFLLFIIEYVGYQIEESSFNFYFFIIILDANNLS